MRLPKLHLLPKEDRSLALDYGAHNKYLERYNPFYSFGGFGILPVYGKGQQLKNPARHSRTTSNFANLV